VLRIRSSAVPVIFTEGQLFFHLLPVVLLQFAADDRVQFFDAHCCYMDTAIKHPVPDWVKPSFVIFDMRAL